MIDGNSLWNAEVTKEMEDKQVAESRRIQTFSHLPVNLYEALKKTASAYPDKAALIDDQGRVYTYKRFLGDSEKLAAYLRKYKLVQSGCHVGLMLYNSAEFCIAFLTLIRLGAVVVPLPSKFKQAEVLSLVSRAEVECVICDEEFADWFQMSFKEEQMLVIGSAGEHGGYECFYKEWDDQQEDIADLRMISSGVDTDPAIIMFTSGTTARSKGILIKHYNIMHAIEAYRRILNISEKDVSVIATPIYHITGLVAVLGLFLYVGGTLYLHRTFDAKRLIRDAKEFGFTFFHASPTVFHLLLEEAEEEIPSLKTFACGSSNMMKEKILRIHAWLPQSKFHTVYGLTETTSPAAIFPDDAAGSPYIGSSGKPIPGTVFKIVDEERRELPLGQVGEIAVSGSVVLHSYYKQESESLAEQWLYTGDLGYFNEDHYLYVVDRKKDMINRGGEKIWCYDVENEMVNIEGIVDAAVVGIPDDLYGEVPASVVQIKRDCDLTGEEIRQRLKKRMATYKIPVKIEAVDSIPQTPNGKIDKIKIKNMLMEDE